MINIAFSPCPNDTFIFHAWVHNLIEGAPKLNVRYADVDITNNIAANPDETSPDIMKISFAALPWVLDKYTLLSCGGALGRGCGPLVLTSQERTPQDLAGCTVAVPSERSTAYLLFRLWAAQHIPDGIGKIVVMPFDQIMPAVQRGEIDAGLVIHEARFTYPSYNLTMLSDLGSWWEEDTGLPIPLGAIVAKRGLDTEAIEAWIKQSLDYAWKHPEASEEYIVSHAQEMSHEVTRAHIDLYVNEFSFDLGEDGYGAIKALLGRAAQEGLIPAVDLSKL
ncbi:1,4-dihydroxy-6-naphtoate synthase [compost metagenome]